jgi:hypothetical protein
LFACRYYFINNENVNNAVGVPLDESLEVDSGVIQKLLEYQLALFQAQVASLLDLLDNIVLDHRELAFFVQFTKLLHGLVRLNLITVLQLVDVEIHLRRNHVSGIVTVSLIDSSTNVLVIF